MSEELIELVRKEPTLYDTNHPDYVKKTLKDLIWDRIAKDVNYKDGKSAKEAWLKLRNCHRDAIRRRISKSGSARTTHKSWKFENQMNFLTKFMTNRSTSSNVNLESEGDQEQSSEITRGENTNDVNNEDDDSFQSEETEQINEDVVQYPTEVGYYKASHKSKKGPSKKKLDDLLARTLERERAKARQSCREDDELFHFFMSMYGSTKKMPPLSQLKVRRQIFNAVSEEEEHLLQFENSNGCGRGIHNSTHFELLPISSQNPFGSTQGNVFVPFNEVSVSSEPTPLKTEEILNS